MGWALWLWASIVGSAIIGGVVVLAAYGIWRIGLSRPLKGGNGCGCGTSLDHLAIGQCGAVGQRDVLGYHAATDSLAVVGVDRRRRSTRTQSASAK